MGVTVMSNLAQITETSGTIEVAFEGKLGVALRDTDTNKE
jgi:hypothetical protein